MDRRYPSGGIFAVCEILADYKPAFTYDFRARFGLGLADIGTTVPWDEVIYLVTILLSDPTSWLQAAKADWKHPINYNWTIEAATYDLLAQVNSKRKPKPWPRPWNEAGRSTKGRRVRKDAREILRKAKDGDIEWQSKHTPT